MNGRIAISLGLVAIALTIAGSAADGDTTPAVLAEAADPNAVQNPERAGSFGVNCYSYKCGSFYDRADVKKDVACKDTPTPTPDETYDCTNNCIKIVLKGTTKGKPVEYLEMGCAYRVREDNEPDCEDLPDPQKDKRNFEGRARSCMCNTTLCNGPKSFPSESGSSTEGSGSKESSSSSVSSAIAFVIFAAVFIAAKMNVL